jgi:hypothetical protein
MQLARELEKWIPGWNIFFREEIFSEILNTAYPVFVQSALCYPTHE